MSGAEKKKRPRRCNQGPKVFAKKVKAKDDAARALELKTAAWHVRDIASELGRSIGWVSEAINKELDAVPLENAKAYQTHVVARHEAVIAAHWSKKSRPENAKVIQTSLRMLVDVLGIDGARKLHIELTHSLAAILDRVKRNCPADVYEQVCAVVAGDDGSRTTEGDSASEGEGTAD